MIGKHTMTTKVVRDIETGRILSRRLRWTDGPWSRLMGVRFPTVATNTFIGPLPANATETVVLTTSPINEPIDNAQILLFYTADVTPGTSVTSHVFRIRRGTTTGGVLVNAVNFVTTVVAGARLASAGLYFDSPGVVAGQQYSLTVVQTAATVAGTWNDGCLLAMVL